MVHGQPVFSRKSCEKLWDKDSFAMFRLITDFFLNELKLDFVTKEEIDHIIGEEVGFDLLHDFIIFP